MAQDKGTPKLSTLKDALAAFGRPFASAAKAAASSFRRPAPAPKAPGLAAVPWKIDTGSWSLELLKRLEWRRFEEVCAAYFEAIGFDARSAHAATDGSLDISLRPEGAERATAILQCKVWNAYGVGVKPVIALREAMAAAQVREGVLATPGRFTQEARALAAKENIRLIDGTTLLEKIAELTPEQSLSLLIFATDGDFTTPTCPSCSVKMVSRRSTKAGRNYWGCPNYPRCKQMFYGTVNAPA